MYFQIGFRIMWQWHININLEHIIGCADHKWSEETELAFEMKETLYLSNQVNTMAEPGQQRCSSMTLHKLYHVHIFLFISYHSY